MKIAILGGAFDPPHLGHLIVASEIREYMSLDEIWFMPVFSHPFNKSLSPAPLRLAMTKLIERDFIKSSDFEIKRNDISYTIDTLELLSNDRSQDTFYWCIGSDMLKDFRKWKEWQNLIQNYNIIIYPRGNGISDLKTQVKEVFDVQSIPEKTFVIDGKDVVISNISSTLVRNRIQNSRSIKYIVPDSIITFIAENKLYKNI